VVEVNALKERLDGRSLLDLLVRHGAGNPSGDL
jgi:hypothetical protein